MAGINTRVTVSRAHEAKRNAIQCFINEKEPNRSKRTYADIVVVELTNPYMQSALTQIWTPSKQCAKKIALIPGVIYMLPEFIPDAWGKQIPVERFLLHESKEDVCNLLKELLKLNILP